MTDTSDTSDTYGKKIQNSEKKSTTTTTK